MLFAAIPVLAAVIAYAPPRHHHTKKKHQAPAVYDRARSTKDPGVIAERALRRRLVRLARIAYFERREAQLTAFLTKTRTESPVFDDPAIANAGAGVSIGPTAITADFLGSAVVRARARNGSSAPVTLLVTVTLRAADGRTARASTVVRSLAPGESRSFELTSPQAIVPVAAAWSAQSL